MDYIDFQDRSHPLGYLLTFTCYGTWLHGDERYSVDRRSNNKYGAPKIPANENLVVTETQNLKYPPFRMDKRVRSLVGTAIKEVCKNRGHTLHALNVRSKHVHVVTSTERKPEFILNSFKAYSTRRLRESALVDGDRKLWTRHGSTRYLWTESHISSAIDYVLYCQDFGIPKFD